MKLTLFDQIQIRRLRKLFLFWILAISVPYAVLCTPIYHVINSDVLLSGSILSLLLDLLMDFLNQLFYWSTFAIFIYFAARHGIAQCKWLIGVYSISVLLRYVANLLAGYVTIGFPLTLTDFFEHDLWPLLFDIVLDIVLLGIIYFILRALLPRFPKNNEALIQTVFPLQKIFTLENPIQKAIFFAAVLPGGVRVLSRVIYDLFYGAPTSLLDLLWMIIYYMLDLLGIVIGIIVMTMILNRLYIKETIAKAEDQPILPN